VLVAPAVGEPLPEPGARDLTADLGLEAAAGVAGASGHRALDVAELRPHAHPERATDGGSEFHAN